MSWLIQLSVSEVSRFNRLIGPEFGFGLNPLNLATLSQVTKLVRDQARMNSKDRTRARTRVNLIGLSLITVGLGPFLIDRVESIRHNVRS